MLVRWLLLFQGLFTVNIGNKLILKLESSSDSPTVWLWWWSFFISICRGTSFCMICPNLRKTEFNVCCSFNFYLITTSSYGYQMLCELLTTVIMWTQVLLWKTREALGKQTSVITAASEMLPRLTASPVPLLGWKSWKFLSEPFNRHVFSPLWEGLVQDEDADPLVSSFGVFLLVSVA